MEHELILALRRELLVDCGREREIAFGDAAGVVRPGLDIGAAPREVDIGMVALLLRHGADAIDEVQGAAEIRERERSSRGDRRGRANRGERRRGGSSRRR